MLTLFPSTLVNALGNLNTHLFLESTPHNIDYRTSFPQTSEHVVVSLDCGFLGFWIGGRNSCGSADDFWSTPYWQQQSFAWPLPGAMTAIFGWAVPDCSWREPASCSSNLAAGSNMRLRRSGMARITPEDHHHLLISAGQTEIGLMLPRPRP